jgi:hypothetical protein
MRTFNVRAFVVAAAREAKREYVPVGPVILRRGRLVPAIHVLLCRQDVDARDKHGHDDLLLHFRKPRRVARHQVDLEIDLGRRAPAAERRHIERVRDDQHRKYHVLHRIHRQ